LEEVGQKGPTALNIKEVARLAEVSVGSLYQYFGNREGLLNFAIALCARYMTVLGELFGQALENLPIREALSQYLKGGMEWGRTEAGLVRFFGKAAYQGDPELVAAVVRPVAEVFQNIVVRILDHAQERGEIRSGVDLEATSRVVHATLIAIGDAQLISYLNDYYLISDENMSLARVVDAMIEMVSHGILA
jgi:AcrR family transcriptional regulator